MKYLIKTYGGKDILLSEQEYIDILKEYDRGAEEFPLGGQRIMRSSICYIGFSDSYPVDIKLEKDELMMNLPDEEVKRIRGKEYEKAIENNKKEKSMRLEATKKRVLTPLQEVRESLYSGTKVKRLSEEKEIHREPLPMTSEEEAKGDQMFWVDDMGVKHFD